MVDDDTKNESQYAPKRGFSEENAPQEASSEADLQQRPLKSDLPSKRIFRRSRRAVERRKQAAREDANFFKAVFSLAGVATAFVFILIFLASSGGGGGLINLAPLSEPSFGPFSILEIVGFGLIAVLSAIYWIRIRKK